jgi:hypothetical protein
VRPRLARTRQQSRPVRGGADRWGTRRSPLFQQCRAESTPAGRSRQPGAPSPGDEDEEEDQPRRQRRREERPRPQRRDARSPLERLCHRFARLVDAGAPRARRGIYTGAAEWDSGRTRERSAPTTRDVGRGSRMRGEGGRSATAPSAAVCFPSPWAEGDGARACAETASSEGPGRARGSRSWRGDPAASDPTGRAGEEAPRHRGGDGTGQQYRPGPAPERPAEASRSARNRPAR